MNEILSLPAHRLRELLDSGEFTSVELTRAYIERCEAVDSTLNCFVTPTYELAIKMAEAADEKIKVGASNPFTGIPVGLKDLLVTKGVRTTCSSLILADWSPPYQSTAVTRLLDSGAVLLGKLNMDEFAMGSSNETSAYGPVKNPWDNGRVPGGSSGGSAAAVSARLAPVTLGSDTGGSIRQPAAFCGVVGMKPTYGRVSRYGLIAFASSLDQIGPFAGNVKDAALLYEAVAGHDPLDSTSVEKEVGDVSAKMTGDVAGMTVGVPDEYFIDGMDPEVVAKVEAAIKTFEELGAKTSLISLPHSAHGVAVYYLIATAEASSNLARFDGVRFGLRVEGEDLIDTYMKTRSSGFGDEVKRRIMLGTYALSAGYYDAYYRRAQRVRTLVIEDFNKAFEEVDVIISPTTPTPAFREGEKIDDPLQMYLNDIFTIPANLAGLPGISLPCGFTEAGLPVGVQLMAAPFREDLLFNAAYSYERASGLADRFPEL